MTKWEVLGGLLVVALLFYGFLQFEDARLLRKTEKLQAEIQVHADASKQAKALAEDRLLMVSTKETELAKYTDALALANAKLKALQSKPVTKPEVIAPQDEAYVAHLETVVETQEVVIAKHELSEGAKDQEILLLKEAQVFTSKALEESEKARTAQDIALKAQLALAKNQRWEGRLEGAAAMFVGQKVIGWTLKW